MRRLALFTIISMLAPAPLVGQVWTDSTLADAIRLVTEGQGDSARALVRSRLAELSPFDSLYAEALFVSGAVAEDAESALAAYRRVSIEFSQSSWADQALLRTAQLHYARGDLETAQRTARRILSDYPFSDVRASAAYWVARTHLDRQEIAAACPFLRIAADSAGQDIELANRASFSLQRCEGDAVADSVEAPAAGPKTYSVQVAAVRTAAAADRVMRDVRSAGYTPRVVRDDAGFFKVRVGRFRSRDQADRVRRALRESLGGTPFIVEEQ